MLTSFLLRVMGCHKVFQTNFSYTKAHAQGQAPSISAVSKSIAAMVRELCVSNKQKKKKKKKKNKTKWAILTVSVLDVRTIPK